MPRTRLALLVVGVIGTSIASVAPASAWVYDGTEGNAGAVTATARVLVGDVSQNAVPNLTLMTEAGPVVTRSAATGGAQDVSVFYSVQRYNGARWVHVAHQLSAVRIRAGHARGRLPNLYVQPTSNPGYYRVQMLFTWYVAGSGAKLGATAITPDVASDHVCITRARACLATPGFVRVGRLIMTGGGW